MNTICGRFWLCGSLILACSPPGGRTPDPPQGSRLAFLVSTITPAGRDTTFRSGFWNGAEHLDTVGLALVDGSSTVKVDSVTLQGRSGPVRMLDDLLPNVTEADSLGRYARFPQSLLARKTPKTGPLGVVITTIYVPAAIDWARRNMPALPYLTRLRVMVWQSGRPTQAELDVQHSD